MSNRPMKYIITEEQFNYLIEQPDSVMGRRASGAFYTLDNLVMPWCKKNRGICFFTGQVGLWFIPYVGPYLSTALGAYEASLFFKEGKTVEGVISLLSSPLALMKMIKVLKLKNASPQLINTLIKLNKSGLPLYVSKGKEEVLNFINKNLTDDEVKLFTKSIPDIMESFKENICEEIGNWKIKNKSLYDKLSQNERTNLDKICAS